MLLRLEHTQYHTQYCQHGKALTVANMPWAASSSWGRPLSTLPRPHFRASPSSRSRRATPLAYVHHKLANPDPLQFLLAAREVRWTDPLPRSGEDYVWIIATRRGDEVELVIRSTEDPADWHPSARPRRPDFRRIVLAPATPGDAQLLALPFPPLIHPSRVKDWTWQKAYPLPADWPAARRDLTEVLIVD